MNYIGDLSKYDYEILKKISLESNNILEFGVGASTQILRNFSNGNLTSIETSSFWIDMTKKNLKYLNIEKDINFLLYEDFNPKSEKYDFIFNDGVESLRNEFAIRAWPNLNVGGIIAYHDTRRKKDVENVIELINNFKYEIDSVSFNKDNSNITLIKKKIKDDVIYNNDINFQNILNESRYYDWNDAEHKTRLKYGISMNSGYEIPKHLT
jgi:hypothetical protein